MALLYPRSKNLQSHLSEYFIVVVRLSHQLLKFTQKSPLGQFASTLSDSDIRTFQSELDLWANLIKEELSVMITNKIEEEAQENFRFRALLSKFSKSVSPREKLETNLRVLGLCSKYDHETAWKQTRKVGKATLFNQNAEYQDWKGQSDSCTIVYTGKLGSGKSVLLANIVDDLYLYVQSENIVVAYFFASVVNANATNEDSWKLLWWAARKGYAAVVELLLDSSKADANLKDSEGQTPLSWAAKNGHEAIVNLLLDSNEVNTDSKDNKGHTPLLWAAENGHKAVVKLLLDSGKVDPDLKDYKGQTALLQAVYYGREAVVKLLLDSKKVNPDLRDDKGRIPLSWATKNRRTAMVKLLLDSGKVDPEE